jgi:hypothetical protein
MSVGSVGMLSPSGRSQFKRGTTKATIPAIISVVPRYFFMAAKEPIGNGNSALPPRFAPPRGDLQHNPVPFPQPPIDSRSTSSELGFRPEVARIAIAPRYAGRGGADKRLHDLPLHSG